MQHLRKICRPGYLAIAALMIHAILLGWISAVNSPNSAELAHLASGMSHWQLGRFDLFRVNPPLVRMLAALPVLLTDARTDWSIGFSDSVYSRPEFAFGSQFVEINGRSSFWYITLARWSLIPFCLMGGWVCYRWARDLYGDGAGLTAVALYCFCPNMLAWGSSITPDAVSAGFGLLAGYEFWRWLRQPGWSRAVLAGIALGLAELTKTTWLLLFALWPLLGLIWCTRRRVGNAAVAQIAITSQMLVILVIGVYFINLGYAFEGSFKPLGGYRFISRALSGEVQPQEGANRFAGSWIAGLPLPFPENYVSGIDVQKYDFERKKWSYLHGEQRKGGWWYYYLYCALVKTPIGTLALGVLALALAGFIRQSRGAWLDRFVVLAPALAIFVLVSSQTGFNRYYRYALPALPFFYVAVSRVGHAFTSRRRIVSVLAALSLAASIAESLAVFPHSFSFFNLFVGGPRGGDAHLVDANIDWGQDLLFLKKWFDAHPDARPLHVAYFAGSEFDPRIAGIAWEPVPKLKVTPADQVPGDEHALLEPGWYAVSVNYLRGYRYLENDEPVYAYFQGLQPIARAGYSICIYHVAASAGTPQPVGLVP